ncbi:unnamed protein product [Lathyrus oleraceus]
MTSSTQNPTDNEANGQEQSESQMQPEISHAGIDTQFVQYTPPPQLGSGHAMVPPVYPYSDAYYRSMSAPYEAQAYPPHPYDGHPMNHTRNQSIINQQKKPTLFFY